MNKFEKMKVIIKKLLIYSSALFLCSCTQQTHKNYFFSETVNPVPSKEIFPGVSCWNAYARSFIYAPEFAFKTIKGAEYYDYILTIEKENKTITWTDKRPDISLSRIWAEVPVGIVKLKVIGINLNGDTVGIAGEKRFYRASPFTGILNAPKMHYRDAAVKALEYIYKLPHVQKWLTNDEPDVNYSLYGYPSKIISSLINGMLVYSALPSTTKEDSAKAMTIAVKMGNYLIKISKSKCADLSAFAPTYDMEFVEKRIKVPGTNNANGVNDVARINANKLMLPYGCEYGNTLLNLYERTKETKWMQRAISIADAYKKLQLPNGTWYLKLDYNTAQPADTHMMMPIRLMNYLKRIEIQFGNHQYKDVIEKANQWIQKYPMKTFFWEGQFEDSPSCEMYRNLSKYPPTDYAMYILKNEPATEKNIQIAKELVRFGEDQFVIWVQPPSDSLFYDKWVSYDTVKWLTPGVLEQYNFYVPIDASARQMIISFVSLYQVTKDSIYLQKATALANSITQAQQDNGEITTIWTKSGFKSENWLNCMVYTAITLLDFSNFLESTKQVYN
jgi:hypothetical protein